MKICISSLTAIILAGIFSLAQAQTWVPQNSGTGHELYGVAFADTSTGWAVGWGGSVLHTSNGGNTWVAQNATGYILQGITCLDTSNAWAVCQHGTIVSTTNGGVTWVTQNSGTANWLYGVDFVDSSQGWAVGYYSTILHTTNGGSTWLAQNSGITNSFWGVDFVDPSQGWVVGDHGTILHTTNGGSTWVAQNSGTMSNLEDVAFVDGNNGWAVGGGIVHTTNGGTNWVTQSNYVNLPTHEGFQLNGVYFLNANEGWAVGMYDRWNSEPEGQWGIILRTINGGNTWVIQNYTPSVGSCDHFFGVFFVDATTGWAVGAPGSIFRYFGREIRVISPNGGEQWHILQFDTVRWTCVDYDDPVKIELNRNYPSATWEILSDSSANDGEEAFYITDPLSDHCRVRISALEDTLTDISDADFSIISSQGYLALVVASDPTTPIVNWNAGVMECPLTVSATYLLKNFGNESIVVFQLLEPISSEFSRTTTCDSLFTLAPSQTSICDLSLTFDPSADGIYHDTLLIQTDAINGVGGYVRIPLQGQQISTPDTPQVVISVQRHDARLTWAPITESILGCPVTVTYYLVFYSEELDGPYWFHGYTADTTYVHQGAVRFAHGMFYDVVAITEPLRGLDEILAGGVRMTKEEVIRKLRITSERTPTEN